ncbi:hypothetical protein AGMMS50262_01130 [Bacteroidia bacterium]|nr:hypothetical protein AGMMS50262_01130 [Bacteroidia bacterium]
MIIYSPKGLKAQIFTTAAQRPAAKSATILTVLLLAFAPCIRAQNVLSPEREKEIKESGRYYWEECAAFSADEAKSGAFYYLSNKIIADAFKKSIKQDEVLKALEMNANFDNLRQDGKVVLAWIAQDSVFVTIKKPITKTPISQPAPQSETVVPQTQAKADTVTVTPSEPEPIPVSSQNTAMVPVATDNPVLQELSACKNYREVQRVATHNGLVTGESARGFAYPEKCIIAVFAADGTLSALFDAGSSSRIDLLSGKTVQNPEQHYKGNGYNLQYLQQKKIN